ncbi:MAG: hypothetical protein IKN72_05990 [Clostridia bacterium]|nr:hypothetical protein [Clostridia bacterium]
MKEMPNAVETAVELAKEVQIRDLYIMALEAEANGETLADFIKKLELMMNKA